MVEDGAEALGAKRQGKRIGTHGAPTIFAFYPNKQMTTGEGGIITTDDDDVYEDILSLRNQGRADSGAWLEHDRLGWNYRMDDLSAAVGLAQVERLDELLAKRDAVAERYAALLAAVPTVELPAVVPGDTRSWFVYTILLDPQVDRNAVIGLLAERGVASKPYLPAIHLQPLYRAPPLHFRRRPPQSNCPPDTVPHPDHGMGLEIRNIQGGIPRMAPPRLASWLQSLPPILDGMNRIPISSCSKGSRGLSV